MGIKDLGPALVGSSRVMAEDYSIPVRILLDGLSGQVDGKDYGIMAPMKTNDDVWIADVLTYVRENFGGARQVNPSWVKQVREKYKDRDRYRTVAELEQ